MPTNFIEDHEKSQLWTEIWHLTKANNSPRYKDIGDDLREELLVLFYDLLDTERRTKTGGTLPAGDGSDDERDDPVVAPASDIHDPSLYPELTADPVDWIPWARDAPSGQKRGRYRFGHPEGLVVHWTAGWRNGLKAGNDLMINTGMLYLLGDKDGNIAQSDSLKWWGYHAGKSRYPGVPGTVSNEFAGIELQAAGTLAKKGGQWTSWYGEKIPASEVNTCRGKENIAAGTYHVYTQAQVDALRKVCLWLYFNNPTVFKVENIVGHDEVSPGRKTDPGGSFIGKWTMPEFRRVIADDIDRVMAARR